MDLARRGIARHVYSAEEARPICRLWYCRVGACSFASAAQNIRKEDVRPHAISHLIEVVSGTIGRDLLVLDCRGDH